MYVTIFAPVDDADFAIGHMAKCNKFVENLPTHLVYKLAQIPPAH